ncbi:glycosyltransferase family 2 protein [Thalassovita sp.]|uniref:glycosyltransferase family 2 protein n=1 Tax=Thalassovita sp. TaxID=1979401 RepID=UPI003B5C61B1
MMRIYLHIGLEQVGASRLQSVLNDKREQLLSKGILYPRSPGAKNHTRLYMAVTDPGHVDPLRASRGYADAADQAALRADVVTKLHQEVASANPDTLILSASQLGASLSRRSELERLRDLLAPLSSDIRVIAHVDEQARVLARHYAHQVMSGRAQSLALEQEMAGTADWWDDALLDGHEVQPALGQFQEIQAPPFWLDYTRLVTEWESVFGQGCVTLRPYDAKLFHSEGATEELCTAFGIKGQIGKAAAALVPGLVPAAHITRARQLNELLMALLKRTGKVIPRKLWSTMTRDVAIDGPPINPASLRQISAGFTEANANLTQAFPALSEALRPTRGKAPAWSEADPENGYRASQYLLAFMGRIDRATRQEKRLQDPPKENVNGAQLGASLAPQIRAIMPPLAQQNLIKLQSSSFKPHNRIGTLREDQLGAPYPSMVPRKNRPRTAIVGCMKNEAPYILEWVAYHRAIGVDDFLIYTNDCSDGTDQILRRLQELGILQHRNNDNWSGNSPQQFALDNARQEPVLKNADWIAHIDVDEFMNIRCGNGTLDDFYAMVPGASNVAMTWRLFGHSGVDKLADKFVIEQFDRCAPKYCPKPHTVWGFKTLFRNIGAYEKLSCHRPNKLSDDMADRVKWVNGSGQDMTNDALKNGWRSSRKTIGYDLIQLNHYALRSAESFLVKRQRGRALHVDRSIGLNYWIRMDWNDHQDVTIQRNVPRLRAEYDRLMQDDTLRALHEKGLAWHRAKADELHDMPEFQELYAQALSIKLTSPERVAWALALDMES